MVCPKKGESNKVDIWCQKDYEVNAIPGFFGDIPGLPPLGAVVMKNGVVSRNPSTTKGVYDLVIPQGAKEIADKTFYKQSVSSIKFNDGLQKIGVGSFGGNENLHKLMFPPSLKEIGRLAFMGCGLNLVQFHADCKIGPGAFSWNDSRFQVLGFNQISINNVAEDAFSESVVTFMLDPNDTEHIEFANKIGADVIDRNGEKING